MAKSVTVMQRIKAGRTYPLIRVVFSRNGKPKIDPRATSFYLGTRWIGDLNLFAGEPDVMLSKPLEGIAQHDIFPQIALTGILLDPRLSLGMAA